MDINFDTVRKAHNTDTEIEKIRNEILFSKRIIFAQYNGMVSQFMIILRFITIIFIGIAAYVGYKSANIIYEEKYKAFISILIFIVVNVLTGIILTVVLKFIEEKVYEFYVSSLLLYIYKHCTEIAMRYSKDKKEQVELATYYFTLYDITDGCIDIAYMEMNKIIHN